MTLAVLSDMGPEPSVRVRERVRWPPLLESGVAETVAARSWLTSAVPSAEGDKASFRDRLKGFGMTPTEEPEVLWNFEKFLVSRDGEVIARFAPDVTPDDERITSAIEREFQAG